MNLEHIRKLLITGENIMLEYKECKAALTKEVYVTVCAFLNRFGGELLLGVNNAGIITGVDAGKIDKIKKEFVTAINNPTKLSPTTYLTIEEFMVDSKHILYIYVPPSSQVHRVNNRIYERNEDGDLDITDNTNLVSQLYIRKQNSYTENRVYPFVTLENDLRPDLIAKARKLATIFHDNHPWSTMSDMELLQSMQLYQRDVQTGKSGFILASVLLFGKDSTILSALPHYKTDAILRRVNLDRYDDRDIVKTNLIESYERLMEFIAKHLPDPFYQDETAHRISLRDKIFREVVSNILIHREYSNPYPAKIIIERNQVIAENSNRPHFHGLINPADFSPFPKNPIIAGFFREIGRAEELGSGVRNLFRYTKAYSAGADPQLMEADIFRIIVPLDARLTIGDFVQASDQVTPQATGEATAEVAGEAATEVSHKPQILDFCIEAKSSREIMEFLGIRHNEHFRLNILRPLLEHGDLLLTIPDKPTSPKQKYYTNPDRYKTK